MFWGGRNLILYAIRGSSFYHLLLSKGLKVDTMNLPLPTSPRKLWDFLGHAWWGNHSCPNIRDKLCLFLRFISKFIFSFILILILIFTFSLLQSVKIGRPYIRIIWHILSWVPSYSQDCVLGIHHHRHHCVESHLLLECTILSWFLLMNTIKLRKILKSIENPYKYG